MAGETRQRMVEGAARLLAQRGLQETSFSGVVELTGAPRGSIYHHFPGGKDELVASAVDLAGALAVRLIGESAGSSAVDVTSHFLSLWRGILLRSNFSAGCSVVAVTVATDSPELMSHAAEVFRAWRSRLTELLAAGGLPDLAAQRFAATLIAASEGAVILSRAEQSIEPFDLVAAHLLEQADQLLAAAADVADDPPPATS